VMVSIHGLSLPWDFQSSYEPQLRSGLEIPARNRSSVKLSTA
jgi:hypothetical protein